MNVFFEYLQEYGHILVDFTTEMAAWINLIFRLIDCAHTVVWRHCNLDLSVVVTIPFRLGFQQSKNYYASEKICGMRDVMRISLLVYIINNNKEMTCLRDFDSCVKNCIFIARNAYYSMNITEFQKAEIKNITIEPCKNQYLKESFRLYKELHNGQDLSNEKKLLLYLYGKKFCYLIKLEDEIIGLGLYYFNKKDIKEHTIHEGYTGLKREYTGMGIGTKSRRHALYHFSKVKIINGVSSRVDLDNLASLKSNLRLGFEIKQKYFDKSSNKDRAYLFCDLEEYREKLYSELLDC